MKNFIYKHRFYFIGGVLGTVGGYVYWYYWGCTDNCTIRSVWWRMSLWGAFMGALLLSAAMEMKVSKPKKEERN